MIYADYNGSAPLLPAVKDYLHKRLETNLFANPNAIHSMGQKITHGIEKCRAIISEVIGCDPSMLFFNSGSSEGLSQILHSILEYKDEEKKIIITSPIEHVAITEALHFYQARRGYIIEKVDVDKSGLISLESLKNLLSKHQGQTALVAIMAANNETGVIQPYREIANLCQVSDLDFLCDTTQLIGKGDFHFLQSGIDFAVCSGHKVGAMTGTGFVVTRHPTRLKPYVYGGHQEHGKRAGTQNYLGIETLAIALNDFQENKNKMTELMKARELFEIDMKANFPEVVIMGENSLRLAGTTLISYPGIHGQAVQIELESHDIFVTTSAACSDNQPETSAVLKAMNIADDVGRGVVRISLSHHQGGFEYQQLAMALKSSYRKLKKIKSY
jgi:cysteine desulfurase